MTKDEAFARLGKSKFRSRFKLTAEDFAYIDRVDRAGSGTAGLSAPKVMKYCDISRA